MVSANERYVDYLDFSGLSWKRPEGPPRVWNVFEGHKKIVDEEISRFCIQEVSQELENDVIDFMTTYFLTEEPINVDLGTASDPLAVREFRTLWRDMIRQGVSIVALKVNSDSSTKPVIAGVNVLGILTVEDEAIIECLMQFQSESLKNAMPVQVKLLDESNVLGKYGIDKYLTASGLCVHPSFRGQGLGQELLRLRDDIGLAYQIPASETIFTATGSQILANRVGFEVLAEKKYSELRDEEGKIAFPGVKVEFVKVMGKRFY